MESETTVKQTLSREEAAKYLGVHINTLDKSNVPRVRVGGRVLFWQKTLDKLLAGEGQRGSQIRRLK